MKQQKKLLIIFCFTILLPSVTLSIFGIIALRNERFRLEKQFREKQLERVGLFKSEVIRKISEVENELQYIVLTPSLVNNDYGNIIGLVENRFKRNRLSGQFFVEFEGNEPLFPPFRMAGNTGMTRDFTDVQKRKLEQADNNEFSKHNYIGAILILEEVLKATEDKNLQVQLLNRIARNKMKQNNFEDAIATYNQIIVNFPESTSSSGTPLPVTVRLQLVECYLGSDKIEEALKETLNAYKEIIGNFYNLSENQFSAYTSFVREKFMSIRSENPEILPPGTSYADDFEHLNTLCQAKVMEWQDVITMKNECIPDIFQELMQDPGNKENRFHYSKKTGSENFLILSTLIPGETEEKSKGIAGIKINNTFLEDSLLPDILLNTGLKEDAGLTLTDQDGRLIAGDTTPYNKSTNITSYFDDNFPPWRIEVSGTPIKPQLFEGFIKSFYFWTILTVMLILVFGIVIIGRTIAHEKEILQLKSDFVSSVSHEFKTPITSIKALTERLLEGTVKSRVRVREYYSVIARDAENLNRLVNNFLDFSKIEEGKKEYNFEKSEFKEWLEDEIVDFSVKTQNRKIIFHSCINEPSVPVKFDKNAMKLAIDNLLDNAVKFSSEKSEVQVILEKQEKNLLVRIEDSGTGIPQNELDKIFEKFYRGKNSSASSVTGTGLGLAIVKQVIEAHGGSIDIESEVDKGSTFTVMLPLSGT